METKTEALEMARQIDDDTNEHLPVSRSEISAMLQSQVAEIERLAESCNVKHSRISDLSNKIDSLTDERDQLKDKNEKLVSSLVDVMSWIANWSPEFTCDADWPACRDAANEALKENT